MIQGKLDNEAAYRILDKLEDVVQYGNSAEKLKAAELILEYLKLARDEDE